MEPHYEQQDTSTPGVISSNYGKGFQQCGVVVPVVSST